MLCIYFWKFSTFIWVKFIQKQQKYPKKKTVNLCVGVALYYELQNTVKGEVQSRITIISKESIKIFPTDWCKNYENRIRNKEVVAFWNFKFFQKTFLDQSLWIFKWASWWCHRLTICHIYYTWNFENFHFFFQIGVTAYPCIKIYQNIHYFSHFLGGYKARFTFS